MKELSVSIIIVTYNGMPWLTKCLNSCKGHTTIVVDNASTDDTITFIKQNYKEIIILPQAKNLGFGAANNIGISYALNKGAEQVFLLNQDAYLVDDALDTLVKFQKENPSYGILSPIHINAKQDKLDIGFANYTSFSNNPFFVSDAILKKTLQPVYEVPFVNAAAWLLSKACLETVGGFDPLFFHYGEDDNYCQRVLFHKFKIGIIPNVYVIHDREHRDRPPIHAFTEPYFLSKEKHFKVVWANVNLDNNSKTCKQHYNRLLKESIKALMQLNFKGFKGKIIEYKRLKAIKNEVMYSKNINKTKGKHYLDF